MIDGTFVQNLAGMSEAELPISVIDSLGVVALAATDAVALSILKPTLTQGQLDLYSGYKAIMYMKTWFYLGLAQKIRDNFNEFSRYDNLDALFATVADEIAKFEAPDPTDYNQHAALFTIVRPAVDPVIGESRR